MRIIKAHVSLFCAENPVADEDDYRIEVLISLRRLERLDKDDYTEDERQEAEEVMHPVISGILGFHVTS